MNDKNDKNASEREPSRSGNEPSIVGCGTSSTLNNVIGAVAVIAAGAIAYMAGKLFLQ